MSYKIDINENLMNLMKKLDLTESKNPYDRDTFNHKDGKFSVNKSENWLGDIKENRCWFEVCHPTKTSSSKTPSIVLGFPEAPRWRKNFTSFAQFAKYMKSGLLPHDLCMARLAASYSDSDSD
jgi:hypothetical protein